MGADSGQAVAGVGNTPVRRGRGWGLSSLPACRRRLARLLSDIDSGYEQDLPKARTLIYGLAQIIACHRIEAELSIIERIEHLETIAASRRGKA